MYPARYDRSARNDLGYPDAKLIPNRNEMAASDELAVQPHIDRSVNISIQGNNIAISEREQLPERHLGTAESDGHLDLYVFHQVQALAQNGTTITTPHESGQLNGTDNFGAHWIFPLNCTARRPSSRPSATRHTRPPPST